MSTGHDGITWFTVRDKPWSYRAEGNRNLVISLKNMGKILRLPKTSAEQKPSNEDVHNLHHLVSFVDGTVVPLLGRNFVQTGEIVRISADELLRLNDELQPLRPESRRHKTLASQKDGLALLQSDHCSMPRPSAELAENGLKLVGPIVTLEIKPKMGFVAMPPDDSNVPATRICKYHLMQLWKLHRGKIAKISGYCPLDLFSGCPNRMTKSLRQLLLNPQNNLRIFKDGSLVYGEGFESRLDDVFARIFHDETDHNLALDRMCRLVVDALLFDHPVDDLDMSSLPEPRSSLPDTSACQCRTQKGTSYEDVEYVNECEHEGGRSEADTKPIQCVRPAAGSILNRLLYVQMLHGSEASSLRSAYHRSKPRLTGLPSEVTRILLYGGSPNWKSVVEAIPDLDEDDVRQIRHYLLSCTARDCSIMLKLCQLENEFDKSAHSLLPSDQFIITDTREGVVRTSFLCSLAYVDLDWKHLSRVIEHADQEIVLHDLWASSRLPRTQ